MTKLTDYPITYEIVQSPPLEEIIELYQEAGWWEESPRERHMLPALIKGSFCFLVARYQGKIIGMGRIISDGVSDAYIQDLVVKKEWRGKNVGKELVRRLTSICMDDGLEWIGLIAEPHTAPFYEALGFHILEGYNFMMKTFLLDLNFQPLTIENQDEIGSFFRRYPQKLAIYTFASLVSWSLAYFFEWVFLSKETLLISAYNDKEKQRYLLQPLGEFPHDCQQMLLKKIEQHPYPLKIFGVTDAFIENYPEFCSHFEDRNECPYANYIYRTTDLANLAGRHYEKKRNLISQAEELYHWTAHPLTKKCHPRCLKILLEIGPKTSLEIPQELQHELTALKFVLAHFEQLNQKGLVICVESHPVAFSIYEELNPQTAVIHFEKADRQYKGMYQLINRETAKAISAAGYELINREEDLGLKGLRQAKQSYFPVGFETSHMLTFIKKV